MGLIILINPIIQIPEKNAVVTPGMNLLFNFDN